LRKQFRQNFPKVSNCANADENIEKPWSYQDSDLGIKSLDKARWLVDAGDDDHDGRSELRFSIDDYDRGGNRLFYDHFEKRAVSEFSYQ
jgi:hypothetical protein